MATPDKLPAVVAMVDEIDKGSKEAANALRGALTGIAKAMRRYLSSRAIAGVLNCSKTTVLHYLHQNNIDTSVTTYGFGTVYVILYQDTPIYIGCTTLSLRRRLKAHISKANEPVGRFATFISDNDITEDQLQIVPLQEDVPVEELFEVEKGFIYTYAAKYGLLNDIHNSVAAKQLNTNN